MAEIKPLGAAVLDSAKMLPESTSVHQPDLAHDGSSLDHEILEKWSAGCRRTPSVCLWSSRFRPSQGKRGHKENLLHFPAMQNDFW